MSPNFKNAEFKWLLSIEFNKKNFANVHSERIFLLVDAFRTSKKRNGGHREFHNKSRHFLMETVSEFDLPIFRTRSTITIKAANVGSQCRNINSQCRNITVPLNNKNVEWQRRVAELRILRDQHTAAYVEEEKQWLREESMTYRRKMYRRKLFEYFERKAMHLETHLGVLFFIFPVPELVRLCHDFYYSHDTFLEFV